MASAWPALWVARSALTVQLAQPVSLNTTWYLTVASLVPKGAEHVHVHQDIHAHHA